MDAAGSRIRFSERYGQLRAARDCVREGPPGISEQVAQCQWYDQVFDGDGLRTVEGHALRVISPGWWNHGEGPDFKGAQIEFNGELHTGDVEVHLEGSAWRAHGHHLDARYDGVILHVVAGGAAAETMTSEGRRVPTLLLEAPAAGWMAVSDWAIGDESPEALPPAAGRCAAVHLDRGLDSLARFLHLSGEWRILNKARAMREQMERAGGDQAVYEALMYACGFGHFKHHFKAVARGLPYERARQLAQRDPLLLEAALLQIAGLLPRELPEGARAPHHDRLRALQDEHLAGLRSLPLTWRRAGVRPVNNPERRLAGVARFVARTARLGLVETLDEVWREDVKPVARRRLFEALFPRAMGFWAAHCTWTGKAMARPAAPVGAGRVRSVIGNVFIPAGLAVARRERDRTREERIYAFFAALPQEPDNHVIQRMLPRILGETKGLKLDFRTQQGLLQMYADWCEPNPSCHNCRALNFFLAGGVPEADGAL